MNAQIKCVMVTSTSEGGTMSKHMTTWGNVHLNMKHTYCNYPAGASSEFAIAWEDVTCVRCLAKRKQ